jgi:hypothetical protein
MVKAAATSLCVLAAGLSLAGCETAGILGGDQVATQTVAPPPPPPPPAPQMIASLSLSPIIGAPDALATQMREQVVAAAERSRIAILPDRDPKADYGMRGYIVAARDKGAIKVSYIWDITDPTGKRVNRVTGEEATAQAAGGKDPWASVTPAVTQVIAEKLVSSLAGWLPTQPKSSAALAGAPIGAAAGAGAGTLASRPIEPAAASTATTASLPPADTLAAAAPVVSGAPGDGNSALADALQRELVRQGVRLTSAPGSYQVEGKVAMGAVKDGKQPIQIDWRVKDAKGASVGTVTQKNTIPPGSLDASWGKTAEAAAAAAAQGIIKLLPQGGRTATN